MTAISNITRDFTVNPDIIGMDAINATGRNKYVTDSVVAAMPRANTSSGQIHFFKVFKTFKVRQHAQEAAKHGFRLVDPHTLAAFNAANPDFADYCPNVTEWFDENGNVCYAAFDTKSGKRTVSVNKYECDWDDSWLVAYVSE